MNKRTFLTFAAMTLGTSMLSASDHKVPLTPAQQVAKKVARLTVQLTLTPAQQASATTIFTTEQTALAAIETPEQTAHTALQAAILANNAAGIATQAAALGLLEQQEIAATATAEAAFYAMLTPAQKTIFTTRKVAELD